jgi:hypothetical protein
MALTSLCKTLLLENNFSSDSPLEREGGLTYVRFDRIDIEGTETGVRVGFMWCGTVMVWLPIDGSKLDGPLRIVGVEGRQQITLEAA